MEIQLHSLRVYELSITLAEKIGFKEEALRELGVAALLHDIGKTKVPNEILNKKGALTNQEFSIMKKHSEYGADLVKNMGYSGEIVKAVLSHHERPDGKGYPEGLMNRQIPLYSNIIAITDSFDAMTNDRCYKKSISVKEAIDEIKDNSGSQFDPEMCKKFLEMMNENFIMDHYPYVKISI